MLAFAGYWRWKSRSLGGRPQIDTDLRGLIRQMSADNPLWGAPRLHGELLKLGFEVAQSSVAKYMVKRRGPPSQGWRTFLRLHAPHIAAMDLFGVPTLGFDLLYAFVIIRLARRHLVWINVTANPTADWIAGQITEAFPWNEAPRYLIRDRDRVYGGPVRRKLADVASKSGFSVAELFGSGRGGKHGPVAIKYRHDKDPSLTWSGRGRRPLWLAKAGGDIERFKIG